VAGSCECGNEPSNTGYRIQFSNLHLNVVQYHITKTSRKIQANKQLFSSVNYITTTDRVSRGFTCNTEHEHEDDRGRGKYTFFASFKMFTQWRNSASRSTRTGSAT
jgi:hypothetical protein